MICPKCGIEINDDIEFCPYCGANLNHVEKEEHKYCNICGFELNDGDNFCPVCGNPVKKDQVKSSFEDEKPSELELDKETNNSKQDDLYLKAFVGEKKYYYYKEKFNDINKNPVSWNWCAFLFGPFWFFYRKNFIPAIVFILCTLSFGVLNYYLNIHALETATSSLAFCAWIASGLFGNCLYKMQYQKTLKESEKLSESERINYLRDHGDTNVGFVFLLIGIYITYLIVTTIVRANDYVDDYPFGEETTRIMSMFFKGK